MLLLLIYYWLHSRLSSGPRVTLVLLLAALVLTPARVDLQHDTYAPALVVAVFDLLTFGSEAVLRPLKPILLTLIAALSVGLVFWILARWVFKPKSR
jgi:hypothetical protein